RRRPPAAPRKFAVVPRRRAGTRRTDTRTSARLEGYRGGMKVSRQARWSCMLAVFVVVLPACALTRETSSAQRLQARAAYERGLSYQREKQPVGALTALQEAVALDGQQALYHNALGLLLLQLRRPDLALERFREAT